MGNLGQNIKLLRVSRSLTQKELSDFVGCSPGIISQWEKGIIIPNTKFLFKLSECFNVTLDFLTKGEVINNECRKNN